MRWLYDKPSHERLLFSLLKMGATQSEKKSGQIVSGADREQVIKSNCRGCHGGCRVLVRVKDGRITKIEGDPEFPTNHSAMCSKSLAFQQLVYHPDRVKYPP